jgi:hypothetical protein
MPAVKDNPVLVLYPPAPPPPPPPYPPPPPPATTKYSTMIGFLDKITDRLAAKLSLLVEPLLEVPNLNPIR